MTLLSGSELLAQLEALASNNPPEDVLADDELRTKLHSATRAASLALDRPTELIIRVLLSEPVESTLINIALDLSIFAKLHDGPKTLDSLASATRADPILLKRILRALAAFGALKEEPGDAYSLSPQYSILTDPQFGHAVAQCANFLNPTYQALPEFLKSTDYKNPNDPANTAVQKAFGYKDTDLMGILTAQPASGEAFGKLMSTWGSEHAQLHHTFPVTQRLIEHFDSSISPVMFVDVGGGYGQKAIALKQAIPDLPGEIVVQDLAMSIDRAPTVEGIAFMVHDFLTEQPIKGAKTYYIRQCLHNYPDDACITILRHLKNAMEPRYSQLLIHEQITPETGASTWASIQDINMMALCGVAERTEAMWRDIIEKAGLQVQEVFHAKDGVSEGVIEAVRSL